MKKHFSVEEIEEIRRALAEQGVKDTDFTTASELNDEDKFAIVQEEENKLIDTSVLSGKVFADYKEYIDSAVEVVSDKLDTEIIDRATKDSEFETKITNLENIPIWNGGNNSLIGNTKTNVVGFTSSAFGSSTRASGMCSFAEGINTVASGNNSHAEGSATKATAVNAHSEGDTTQANGAASHAEGYMTKASGKYSHSEGFLCDATGERSHAEGSQSAATGIYSHAEGLSTIASANSAHAEGKYNEDDTNLLHSVGIGSGDSARKNAEAIYTDGKKYVYGVGNYDGTKASIEKGALDIATYEQKLLTVVTNTSSSVAGCVRLKTTDAQHISGNMLFCDDGLRAKFANFGILTDGSSSLSIRTDGIVTQNNLLYIKDIGNYNESIDDEGVEDVATVINNIQSSVTDEVTRATAAEKVNSDAIDLLNDEESVEGSVKYIAKQYADKVKTILINVSFDGWTCDYTFDEIKALINGSDDIPTFVLRGLSSALSTAPSVVYSTSAKIYSTYLCIEVYTTSDNNPYRAVVYLPSTNGRPAITSDDSFRLASSNEVENSITSHNTDADSHSDIRTLISNETSARQSADTTLEAKIPTTTEDFVFTLEDGTEVTKSIYVK